MESDIRAGCEVKCGKHIAIKIPDAKKNIRLDSLGDNYSYEAILERLSGAKTMPPKSENAPSLLIDIQEKISEGKSGGYVQWSKIFNLKQAAKTLMFLQELGIDSYDELVKKSAKLSSEFHNRLSRIKVIESRLKEIAELQKHIGVYGKTLEVFKQYKASGRNADFYENNRADIELHKAAKKYFNSLNLEKLPKISELKQEYATLAAEKKKLYSDYHELKEKSRELSIAKRNADVLLGITPDTKKRDDLRKKNHNNSHEI